jgi:hypothetical protein
MFKQLIDKIASLSGERERFDPSSLDDPIAMQTEWRPAKNGGANFRTHRLVAVDATRMEFRPTFGAILFYLVFILMGGGVSIAFLFAGKGDQGASGVPVLMPLLIGLVFVGIGGAMLWFGTAPIVFDKQKSFFWKGRKAPDEVFDRDSLKAFANLHEVHAIQLISEWCRGNKSSYFSYELNLVLETGERVNVVDHGSRNKLREDAVALAEFLDKPLWDAI